MPNDLRSKLIRLAHANPALRPHLLPLVKDAAFYRNDPRWIKAKYPGVDKKGTPFKKGEEVLYWPSSKEIMAGDYAKNAWERFLSEKGDEEGDPYAR